MKLSELLTSLQYAQAVSTAPGYSFIDVLAGEAVAGYVNVTVAQVHSETEDVIMTNVYSVPESDWNTYVQDRVAIEEKAIASGGIGGCSVNEAAQIEERSSTDCYDFCTRKSDCKVDCKNCARIHIGAALGRIKLCSF